MKRYKDCSLICNENQRPIELLDIVMQVSKSLGYKFDRYSVFSDIEALAIYIQEEGLPYSRLIINNDSELNAVVIVNIIPMQESNISEIDCVEYNKLLDSFRNKVFRAIQEQNGNSIKENSEDYEISDIIPKSYQKLNTWLDNYPLSGHPLDEKRWYDFVISLHINQEKLYLDDFKKYIQEQWKWEEETIEKFALKLESHIELLEYYDKHR